MLKLEQEQVNLYETIWKKVLATSRCSREKDGY